MSKYLTATLLCDFYKISHKDQYPVGTEEVYSTWTPRSNKHLPQAPYAVCFGVQGFVKEFLVDFFNDNFFNRPKNEVVNEYNRFIKNTLFVEPDASHIEKLHDLGYLPLEIKSLEEGTKVPFRVPMLTIRNTNPEFAWLTNYIETMASANLWKPSTTATIASLYRGILDKYALETTGSVEGVEFQGHDFSMRGMSGVEDAARAGAGHLLSFAGTDTIPAIQYLEQFYNANIEEELVGTSVPATEHSVMCSGGKENEFETYKTLINETYPSGIVSIVSDTWDLWNVITNYLPQLKDDIMARSGGMIDKVVIRPDSGDPTRILCGDPEADPSSPAFKGVVELLWDIFGGTTTEQGFKVLDSHIGAIYGDAITLERCEDICKKLMEKGFASTNVVYGIGSFTYQHLTRDSLGFAMKATNVVINGESTPIFKDPITDDGTKKSARGKVAVYQDPISKEINYMDSDSPSRAINDLLTPIYRDGELLVNTSLSKIKGKLNE